MTATEYQHWLVRVFGKEKERRLLVVDSYNKPHQSEGLTMAKERCNADVIIIPGGSLLEIMNMGLGLTLKTHFAVHTIS